MLKIAVIGAGKGGCALLDIFHANGNVKIIGITDNNKNAPGLKMAKEWGIFIAHEIKELFDQKPDIVINATGHSEIGKRIKETSPYPVEVIEGMGAKCLWELVSRQQMAKKDMESLYRYGLVITKAKNLKEVLDEALRSAMELTETPAGSIVLSQGEDMVPGSQKGLRPDFFKKQRWKIQREGPAYHILKQTGPVAFYNIEQEPLFENTTILKEGVKSILACPLITDGTVFGILYLDDFKPRTFTDRHKNLIFLFSNMVAQTIEKYKLLHDHEESLAYLQGMLNDSQDMIITTDSEGRVVKYSTGGERILGYKTDEVVGKKVSEFYVNKDERSIILKTLHEKGAVYNYETQLIKKNGAHVDISLTISLLRDKTGSIIGTVGISKDITEEKRLREELKGKNRELEELTERLEEKVLERTKELERTNRELVRANEMKGRFIANASHELRTPLHSIIGFSDILLQKTFGDLTEKQQKYTTTILNSGKHLLHLVSNILDLAKIEAGKAELSYQTFPIREVIDEVIMVIQHLAEKKRIHLESTISNEALHFTADKIKFKQILYNLLSNAIKFTPDGGKVGIHVNEVMNGTRNFTWALENQKFFKVSVWDTGIGIKPEDRERIFEEFEQLDPSKTTEGTGLGLTLTKKLVEIHGGHIEVEGTYGHGTAFNIYLPVIHLEEARRKPEPIYPQIEAPDIEDDWPLVLVVEDDLPTVEILTIHLTQAKYKVAHAYDGEEALVKAKELNPLVITLDIMLPKKDGWEVLQSLKINPETREIPVIIHSVIENKELAFALGATDYLAKPIDKTTLMEKLSGLSLLTKKKRSPVNILVISHDHITRNNLCETLKNEGFLIQSSADAEGGINLALANKPNTIIIDLNTPEGGFKIIKQFRENPALKDIPIFAITFNTLSVADRIEMADQVEMVLHKDALGSKELINHLRNVEIMHPKKAGLIDEITGIFNYRYFQIRLTQEIVRATRYNLPIVLMILDIDQFNHYVKKKGTYYGNLVLKKIAKLIKKNIRGSDVLVRFGGDAFGIILTNTLLSSGLILAKRFVSMIHDYPFLYEEVQPKGKITASVGISEFTGQSPEEFVRFTETALSSAIIKGRNRVELYQKGIDTQKASGQIPG